VTTLDERPPTSGESTGDVRSARLSSLVRRSTQLLGVGGFFILIVVYLSIRLSEFFSKTNGINILSDVAVLGVVAIGQTVVLISGGFDLSVSGTVPLSGVVYVVLDNDGHSGLLAGVLAVAVGLLAGFVNGLVVTLLSINPFITTLATASISGGLAYTVSHGQTITLADPGKAPLSSYLWQVPKYVWVLVIIALIAFLVLRYTVFGRIIYSVGGNREATRLAGVRVNGVVVGVYSLSGACAGLAGVMLASELLAGSPTVGTTEGLDSITAVILGGAALTGGTGGIAGSMLGVLVLGTVANGLQLLQIASFYQEIATGVILLIGVGLIRLRNAIDRMIFLRSRA
jgi:ribose transport system permease protein